MRNANGAPARYVVFEFHSARTRNDLAVRPSIVTRLTDRRAGSASSPHCSRGSHGAGRPIDHRQHLQSRRASARHPGVPGRAGSRRPASRSHRRRQQFDRRGVARASGRAAFAIAVSGDLRRARPHPSGAATASGAVWRAARSLSRDRVGGRRLAFGLPASRSVPAVRVRMPRLADGELHSSAGARPSRSTGDGPGAGQVANRLTGAASPLAARKSPHRAVCCCARVTPQQEYSHGAPLRAR